MVGGGDGGWWVVGGGWWVVGGGWWVVGGGRSVVGGGWWVVVRTRRHRCRMPGELPLATLVVQ